MSKTKDSIFFQNVREIRDLKQMLNESCRLFADRPAVWIKKYKGGDFLPVTYRMLKHDVDALGTRLLDMGLKGSSIALLGRGCYEWMVAYLAVVNGVGTIVPIDRELEGSAVQNLADRAECDAIFFASEEMEKVSGLTGIRHKIEMDFYGDRTDLHEPLIYQNKEGFFHLKQLVETGERLIQQGRRDFIDCEIDADAMAVLLFTSGTTGIPKGVMLNHRGIAINITDISRAIGVKPEDKNLSVLPIHHTYACSFNLTFLYCGASVAYFEGLRYIVQNLNETQATYFVLVPLLAETLYEKIWKEIKKSGKEKIIRRAIAVNKKTRAIGLDFSRPLLRTSIDKFGGRLKTIISAASALSPSLVRGFEDLGINVLQAYGLTETSPLITATPLDCRFRRKKAGSTGVCNITGELRIDNPDEDGIGEVCFRGPNVMLGYYKMPEETEAVMEGDWFHTGDLGFLDRDGWLYLTGRMKNVIITKNGENIYPEEIESVVKASPYVSECMVYAAKKNGSETVGIQILPNLDHIRESREEELTPDELQKLMKEIIADINEKMPNYKRIRSIFIRKEDFVRTTTNKIIRGKNI